jgi:multidrug efflux pump
MIARFFIDRPIFAAVLSIVITLTGALALFSLPVAQYPAISPPAVQVMISYPGVSAAVVSDTVAAPIEQQVNGVPGMLYMSSLMGNDGSYTLSVTFDIGSDLDTALVMLQNRVALAIPQLPTSVQRQGITIRKKTPDILQVINIYSPDDRYDALYLNNFALIHLYDEILRIDGVSTIGFLGEKDYSIRPWLDPQKLAARGMTALDVAGAIRNQNLDAILGQVGQPPTSWRQSTQLPLDTLGRLSDPEQYADIVVKVGQGGPAQPAGTAPGGPPSGTVVAGPSGGGVLGGLGGGTLLGGGALGGGLLGSTLSGSTLESANSGSSNTESDSSEAARRAACRASGRQGPACQGACPAPARRGAVGPVRAPTAAWRCSINSEGCHRRGARSVSARRAVAR